MGFYRMCVKCAASTGLLNEATMLVFPLLVVHALWLPTHLPVTGDEHPAWRSIPWTCTDNNRYRWAGALAPVLALLESRGVADGAYKGFYVQQIALGLSNFIYFYIKNMSTVAVTSAAGGRSLGPTEEFAVTTVAGAVNATLAAPLWNVCDKIKTDSEGRYDGIADCVRKLVARHGVAQLWNGVQAGLLLVSNPIIHYFCYNQVRHKGSLARPGLWCCAATY